LRESRRCHLRSRRLHHRAKLHWCTSNSRRTGSLPDHVCCTASLHGQTKYRNRSAKRSIIQTISRYLLRQKRHYYGPSKRLQSAHQSERYM